MYLFIFPPWFGGCFCYAQASRWQPNPLKPYPLRFLTVNHFVGDRETPACFWIIKCAVLETGREIVKDVGVMFLVFCVCPGGGGGLGSAEKRICFVILPPQGDRVDIGARDVFSDTWSTFNNMQHRHNYNHWIFSVIIGTQLPVLSSVVQ